MAQNFPASLNLPKQNPPASLRVVRGSGPVGRSEKLYKVLAPAAWHHGGIYRYMPLSTERNWIRLLELLPGTGPIKCNLFYANLDDPPSVLADDDGNVRYQALSYAWGSQSRDHKILVDEQEMPVTKNLHDALIMLRKPAYGTRLLWIDAICIHQVDPVEKTHQISLMGKIYQTASEVVAWLGTRDEHFEPVLDLFRKIVAIDPVKFRSRIFYSYDELLLRAGLPPARDPTWLHLMELFNNAYFERAWIVQELTRSESITLCIGSQTLDWKTFARVCMLMNTILKPLRDLLAVLHQDQRFHRQQRCVGNLVIAREELLEQKPQPFGVNITLFRKFKASDARDKVFAFVGMATDLDTADFFKIADYSKSVEQVYVDATKFLIMQRYGLAMLSHVEDRARRNLYRLPSWVPDYSVETGYGEFGGIELNSLYGFRAAADLPSYAHCVPGTEILQVKGRRVDYVDLLAPTLFNDESGRTDTLGEWMMFVESHEQIDWVRSDIWKVFIADSGSPVGTRLGMVRPAPAQYHNHFLALLGAYSVEIETEKPVTAEQLRSLKEKTGGDADHFIATFTMASGFRALLRTKDQRWGLGPMSSQQGDEVWLLSGAKVPYILRPEEGDGFRLVGETYVTGIMDGEAIGNTNDWKVIDLV